MNLLSLYSVYLKVSYFSGKRRLSSWYSFARHMDYLSYKNVTSFRNNIFNRIDIFKIFSDLNFFIFNSLTSSHLLFSICLRHLMWKTSNFFVRTFVKAQDWYPQNNKFNTKILKLNNTKQNTTTKHKTQYPIKYFF